MSELDMTEKGRSGVKTLAIRLDPTMHAQLSLIAQLRGTTLTDEIRAAIEDRLTAAKTAPDLVTQAGSALDALHEEVSTKRAAIVALFGDSVPEPTPAEAVTKPIPRSRTGGSK